MLALAACHPAPAKTTPRDGPSPPQPKPSVDVRADERACREGDSWKCTVSGIYYYLGDDEQHVPADWPRAASLLRSGCEAKVPEACATLLNILEPGGHGVDADPVQAAHIRRQLCAAGLKRYCTPVPIIELE